MPQRVSLTSTWYEWLLFIDSFAAVPLLVLRLCLQVCLWPRPTDGRKEEAADIIAADRALATLASLAEPQWSQVERGGSHSLLSTEDVVTSLTAMPFSGSKFCYKARWFKA